MRRVMIRSRAILSQEIVPLDEKSSQSVPIWRHLRGSVDVCVSVILSSRQRPCGKAPLVEQHALVRRGGET